jgi:hypothetical protein
VSRDARVDVPGAPNRLPPPRKEEQMANLRSNRSKKKVKNRSKVKRTAAKRAGVLSKKRKRRAKKSPR